MTRNQNSKSFSENYQKLKEIADALRSQTEPDIDAIIPMIETATQAYKQCKLRIEAVKEALKEYMPEDLEDTYKENKE